MFNRIDFKKSIFAVSVVFVMLFSLFFYGSSVFAESSSSVCAESTSDINLDLWTWEEELDDKGNVISIVLTGYLPDNKDNCENIIIPNSADFFLESSKGDKYQNFQTVFISKSVMGDLAKKASKYNGTLRVSDTWRRAVTAFGEDWSDCFNFENNNIKEIDLSYLDTESITNMSNMFANCKNLQTLNLSDFDTGYVTNMSGMFSGCENLEEINLSNFYTGNVTDMSGMFSGCKKLKQLDLSNFDTENVEDVSKMFKNTDLQIIDLSNFLFTDGIKTEEMFDKVSENNLIVLSNELSLDLLTKLTKCRHAMDLKFIFGGKESFAFESVVFCPSDLGISRERYKSLDNYLDTIFEKEIDIFKEKIMEENAYPEGTIIICQPKKNYITTEEKLNGEYIFTVKLPLVEKTDFMWPEAAKDLKYDGQSKELLNGGFISEKLEDNGVKFEYAWAKDVDEITEEEWSDQIPTATDIGTYKICIRVNGGEKYQNVYYVNDDGNDYFQIKIYELELQEDEDYEFAEAPSDLRYDGKEKELLSGGFVSQEKKK